MVNLKYIEREGFVLVGGISGLHPPFELPQLASTRLTNIPGTVRRTIFMWFLQRSFAVAYETRAFGTPKINMSAPREKAGCFPLVLSAWERLESGKQAVKILFNGLVKQSGRLLIR